MGRRLYLQIAGQHLLLQPGVHLQHLVTPEELVEEIGAVAAHIAPLGDVLAGLFAAAVDGEQALGVVPVGRQAAVELR